MSINPEETDTLIDRLLDIFQSNEVAVNFGDSPDAWVEDNLPEGTEAADVARCMPRVADQLGGGYQQNLARYNASHGAQAQAATQHVTHEIAYNYNTIYQQNAFVIAEEGAQVAIVQGDGNTVDQTQIDLDFDVDHPPEWEDYEDEEYPETPEGEEYPETPEGEEYPEDGEMGEEPVEEPVEDPMGDEEPWDEDPVGETPVEDPAPVDPPADPVDTPEAPAADLPEGAEAL